ncbi:MAG: hypothetical protein U0Q03_00225 [Acidimicrobiales bacterium]
MLANVAKPPARPILLDLEQFESIEDALGKIQLTRAFDHLAGEILGSFIDLGGRPTLLSFFFMSAVARARGLREAAVREIEAQCPPAAATLLRQLAEVVATIFYVADFPEYAEAIAFRPDEARPGAPKRKGVQALIHHMDRHHADQFEVVYADLNEMTHFNSAAMWSSHTSGDDGGVRWSSAPRWKNEHDPFIFCATLLELTAGVNTALVHLGHTLVRTVTDPKPAERWVTRPLG